MSWRWCTSSVEEGSTRLQERWVVLMADGACGCRWRVWHTRSTGSVVSAVRMGGEPCELAAPRSSLASTSSASSLCLPAWLET